MAMPPQNKTKACLEVMRYAILQARQWGWQGDVPAERLADLMDAIHNIPALLVNWESCNEETLKKFLADYDRKWCDSDDIRLLPIYERAVAESVN